MKMRVGASYYPELQRSRAEWRRDLEAAREVGLSVLRCGEFAWDFLEPEDGKFRFEWVREFLDLSGELGFRVIWCTPSAAPPPRFFRRWPDLAAVNVQGETMPVGVRRNYTPGHPGYLDACAKMACELARALAGHPALAGWQIDNELSGDGFCCWGGPWTVAGFQGYLHRKFGTLEEFNTHIGGGVWSEIYHEWSEIPVPGPVSERSFPPELRLEFRRYRSEAWRQFYHVQYAALKANGAVQPVTTNFYNLTWDVPFDLHDWRAELDSVGLSHYLEEENATAFQFALMRNVAAGKPFWVLEQKAGQQSGQNLFPDALEERLTAHLRRCRAAGVEYAVYWHLRGHLHGCEMEHGSVLNHDGRIGRIGRAIQRAIVTVAAEGTGTGDCDGAIPVREDVGVVFDFQQQWAQLTRPCHIAWDYRTVVEREYFAAAREIFGEIALPGVEDLAARKWKFLLLPYFQLDRGVTELLLKQADAGATVVLTADYARLDEYNAIRPVPLLDALRPMLPVPDLELIQLADGAEFFSADGLRGRRIYALPFGRIGIESGTAPSFLEFRCGRGRVVVLLSSFDAVDLKKIFRELGGGV